jgi:hypothetical protein
MQVVQALAIQVPDGHALAHFPQLFALVLKSTQVIVPLTEHPLGATPDCAGAIPLTIQPV